MVLEPDSSSCPIWLTNLISSVDCFFLMQSSLTASISFAVDDGTSVASNGKANDHEVVVSQVSTPHVSSPTTLSHFPLPPTLPPVSSLAFSTTSSAVAYWPSPHPMIPVNNFCSYSVPTKSFPTGNFPFCTSLSSSSFGYSLGGLFHIMSLQRALTTADLRDLLSLPSSVWMVNVTTLLASIDDYLSWRTQFTSFIILHQLDGMLDGMVIHPPSQVLGPTWHDAY